MAALLRSTLPRRADWRGAITSGLRLPTPCSNLLWLAGRASSSALRSARVLMRKQYGQHLLKNADVVADIVAAAQIQPHETVFEIGPGTGNMTVHMLKAAKTVYAAELDRRLYEILVQRVEAMGDCPTHGVAFSTKLQCVLDDFLRVPLPPFDALVANIPYQISSPVLYRLFAHTPLPSRAVIMFQLEFAQRMVAKPGTQQYCRLSVMSQLLGDVELIMKIDRKQFRPPPKVDSAVIKIQPKGWPADLNVQQFDGFLRLVFNSKNKTLKSVLTGSKTTLANLALLRQQSTSSRSALASAGVAAPDGDGTQLDSSTTTAGTAIDASSSSSAVLETASLVDDDASADAAADIDDTVDDEVSVDTMLQAPNSAVAAAADTSTNDDTPIITAAGSIPRSLLLSTRNDIINILSNLHFEDKPTISMRANGMSIAAFRTVFDAFSSAGFKFLTDAEALAYASKGAVDADEWYRQAEAGGIQHRVDRAQAKLRAVMSGRVYEGVKGLVHNDPRGAETVAAAAAAAAAASRRAALHADEEVGSSAAGSSMAASSTAPVLSAGSAAISLRSQLPVGPNATLKQPSSSTTAAGHTNSSSGTFGRHNTTGERQTLGSSAAAILQSMRPARASNGTPDRSQAPAKASPQLLLQSLGTSGSSSPASSNVDLASLRRSMKAGQKRSIDEAARRVASAGEG